jgi:hypothetical protein
MGTADPGRRSKRECPMPQEKSTITIQTPDPIRFHNLLEALNMWIEHDAATPGDSDWIKNLRAAWMQFQKTDSVDFITRAGFGEYRPDGDPQETMNALLSAAGAARDPQEALGWAQAARTSVECFAAVEAVLREKAARLDPAGAKPLGDRAPGAARAEILLIECTLFEGNQPVFINPAHVVYLCDRRSGRPSSVIYCLHHDHYSLPFKVKETAAEVRAMIEGCGRCAP